MTSRTAKTVVVLISICSAPASAERYFVDATAGGGVADGSSWSDAFPGPLGVQAALGVVGAGDEIWIAAGVYVPTADADRAQSFAPTAGVALYGGFAGGEVELDQRDWWANPTVLSGDLAGNDGADFTNRGDNAFHVVTIGGQDVLLDGLIIRGGMASDAPEGAGTGGGILIGLGQSVTARHCDLVDNEAAAGGGTAVGAGGGLFDHCRILGNRAVASDGSFGGAAFVDIDNTGSNEVIFTNCLIAGNVASNGGGLAASYSSYTVNSCTVVANTALLQTSGAGILHQGIIGLITVNNSIVWGNVAIDHAGGELEQVWTPQGFLLLNHTCIEEYANAIPTAGSGNTGDAPLFIDPVGPDTVPGTGDEDYRLMATSPLIDRGLNAAVPADVQTDLAGGPRYVDDPETPDSGVGTPPLVDVGAYEYNVAGVPAVGHLGLIGCALALAVAGGWIITVTRRRRRPSPATTAP